jgi:hypothetical protein
LSGRRPSSSAAAACCPPNLFFLLLITPQQVPTAHVKSKILVWIFFFKKHFFKIFIFSKIMPAGRPPNFENG